MSHNLYEQINHLTRAGESFALATVVRVVKPISAKPGDKAIIKLDGSLNGWVGGGCSQDIIIREAKKVINEAEPRFLRLVGSGAVAEKSEGVLEYPITCHSGGTMDVYIEPVLPRPQLILLGNSPVAIALAKLAADLDFEVDVFEPQGTHPEILADQFPTATNISNTADLSPIVVRPLSFLVVSTQGHEDEAALEAAARSGASYIAFVASRKKMAARSEYLLDRGVSPEQIARIKAPAGLDIGATTSDEIATSILAEMIQFRRRQFAPKQIAQAQAVAAAEQIVTEAIDPVCGMTVEVATARYTSDYNGTKYYFCARGCKNSFDRAPEKYIKTTADA